MQKQYNQHDKHHIHHNQHAMTSVTVLGPWQGGCPPCPKGWPHHQRGTNEEEPAMKLGEKGLHFAKEWRRLVQQHIANI